jgi:hypothetical protein
MDFPLLEYDLFGSPLVAPAPDADVSWPITCPLKPGDTPTNPWRSHGWAGWNNFWNAKPGRAKFFSIPAEASDFGGTDSKLCVLKTDRNRFCGWRWGAGRVGPAIRSYC